MSPDDIKLLNSLMKKFETNIIEESETQTLINLQNAQIFENLQKMKEIQKAHEADIHEIQKILVEV